MFRAMGDPTRLQILVLLTGGESNVTLQTRKILADTLRCRISDWVKGL